MDEATGTPALPVRLTAAPPSGPRLVPVRVRAAVMRSVTGACRCTSSRSGGLHTARHGGDAGRAVHPTPRIQVPRLQMA